VVSPSSAAGLLDIRSRPPLLAVVPPYPAWKVERRESGETMLLDFVLRVHCQRASQMLNASEVHHAAGHYVGVVVARKRRRTMDEGE
jgi:hypothetical protein